MNSDNEQDHPTNPRQRRTEAAERRAARCLQVLALHDLPYAAALAAGRAGDFARLAQADLAALRARGLVKVVGRTDQEYAQDLRNRYAGAWADATSRRRATAEVVAQLADRLVGRDPELRVNAPTDDHGDHHAHLDEPAAEVGVTPTADGRPCVMVDLAPVDGGTMLWALEAEGWAAFTLQDAARPQRHSTVPTGLDRDVRNPMRVAEFIHAYARARVLGLRMTSDRWGPGEDLPALPDWLAGNWLAPDTGTWVVRRHVGPDLVVEAWMDRDQRVSLLIGVNHPGPPEYSTGEVWVQLREPWSTEVEPGGGDAAADAWWTSTLGAAVVMAAHWVGLEGRLPSHRDGLGVQHEIASLASRTIADWQRNMRHR